MIIVNGWKLLTIITKSFILDVSAVLGLPLEGRFEAKAKEHYQSDKNSKNILNLILGALFGRVCSNTC